ncbi:hypothetical protein EJ04DRAFT_519203 [Polyplosphaeria fusca]|uniref:Uncharacterized protein n=1 Tax=Polyplosphaeria fusca TaxID=682080 RepID=A0A9P4RBH5_9PLEO|nr:hypothetical protein EJ04DRAFT_519203 [Polyplosphaeria fusca]
MRNLLTYCSNCSTAAESCSPLPSRIPVRTNKRRSLAASAATLDTHSEAIEIPSSATPDQYCLPRLTQRVQEANDEIIRHTIGFKEWPQDACTRQPVQRKDVEIVLDQIPAVCDVRARNQRLWSKIAPRSSASRKMLWNVHSIRNIYKERVDECANFGGRGNSLDSGDETDSEDKDEDC